MFDAETLLALQIEVAADAATSKPYILIAKAHITSSSVIFMVWEKIGRGRSGLSAYWLGCIAWVVSASWKTFTLNIKPHCMFYRPSGATYPRSPGVHLEHGNRILGDSRQATHLLTAGDASGWGEQNRRRSKILNQTSLNLSVRMKRCRRHITYKTECSSRAIEPGCGREASTPKIRRCPGHLRGQGCPGTPLELPAGALGKRIN